MEDSADHQILLIPFPLASIFMPSPLEPVYNMQSSLNIHIPSSLLQLSFSTFIDLLPFSSSLSLLSYTFFPSPALFLYFHRPSSLLQLSFSTFIFLTYSLELSLCLSHLILISLTFQLNRKTVTIPTRYKSYFPPLQNLISGN